MLPKKRKRKELQISLHPSNLEDNYTMGVLRSPEMHLVQKLQIPNLESAAGKEHKKFLTNNKCGAKQINPYWFYFVINIHFGFFV